MGPFKAQAAGLRWLWAVPALLGANFASGQNEVGVQPDPYLELELGHGQSDNVAHDASEVRSDITALGLRFLTTAERPRFQGAFTGDIQARHYGSSAVVDTDEVVGSIDGNFDYEFVDEMFSWGLQQNFGQSRTDPLAPDGPNNRELVSVTSTGPELSFDIGRRNDLILTGRLSERSYQDSNRLDSSRTAAGVQLVHALDEVAALSFSFNEWNTDYDDSSQSAYDVETFLITYSKQFSTGGVEISVGPGEIDTGSTTESTSVGTFAWRRGVGARSNVRIWASREFTDSGEIFRLTGLPDTALVQLSNVPGSAGQVGADPNDARLGATQLVSSPVLRSNAGTRLTLAGRQSEVFLSFELVENRYETSNTLDSDAEVATIVYTREFAGDWRTNARLRASNEDFFVTGVDNRDRSIDVGLTRFLGTATSVSLVLARSKRNQGNDPFEENVYSVSIAREFVQRR